MRITILGCGVMGEAILAAILRGGTEPTDVRVTDLAEDRCEYLTKTYGVAASTDNISSVTDADLVLLAVKPAQVNEVLAEIRDYLGPDTLLVSVAAGTSVAQLEAGIAAGTPVVRTMPNTPALVGKGVTAITPGGSATDAHLVQVEQLLGTTGLVLRLPETSFDTVTAISGSGPGYVFYLIDALAEAGTVLGLTRAQATELALATFEGAAQMAAQTRTHPAILREQVCSPAGTTIAGIRTLDERGVRAAIVAAAVAAHDRSRQMAAG
jgi:pyrroline-5-carboxylate reductase